MRTELQELKESLGVFNRSWDEFIDAKIKLRRAKNQNERSKLEYTMTSCLETLANYIRRTPGLYRICISPHSKSDFDRTEYLNEAMSSSYFEQDFPEIKERLENKIKEMENLST